MREVKDPGESQPVAPGIAPGVNPAALVRDGNARSHDRAPLIIPSGWLTAEK
jgi:hypothetical protein